MLQPDLKWTNRALNNIGQGIVNIGDENEERERDSKDSCTDSSA